MVIIIIIIIIENLNQNFFSGRGEPRITETADTGSVYMGP
jgi:hypothetical protein